MEINSNSIMPQKNIGVAQKLGAENLNCEKAANIVQEDKVQLFQDSQKGIVLTGTAKDDHVHIKQSLFGSLDVKINEETYSFSKKEAENLPININLGEGNNSLVADPNVRVGLNITVGDGENYICTGKGDDVITAGNGMNLISSGKGNDSITVGDGDNRISDGKGNDFIVAGNGRNLFMMGEGKNHIETGEGKNQIQNSASKHGLKSEDYSDFRYYSGFSTKSKYFDPYSEHYMQGPGSDSSDS